MRVTRAIFGTLALLSAALFALPPASMAGESPDCNAQRCGMEEAVAAECSHATHHKRFVKCVARFAKRSGMRNRCAKSMVRCAAKSTAGHPGSVPCTDANGACTIADSPDACRSQGGNVGFGSSCCSACPTAVRCCVPSSVGGAFVNACQVMSADACDAAGGTSQGSGSCDPNPCTSVTTTTESGATTTTMAAPPGETQCCVLSSASGAMTGVTERTLTGVTQKTPPPPPARTCVVTSSQDCAQRNGLDMGPGTCSPDPCAAGASTTTVPGATTTTIPGATTTTTPGATTTTIPGGGGPCSCGATAPGSLKFSTGIGTGSCGTVETSTGTVSKNLACSGLYTGGGSNSVPLPYAVPDMGTTLTKVGSCSGTTLTLANSTSSDTGSNRNCSSAGCLFGPPLPIPNAGSPATSVCVVNVVATDASGSTDCTTGASILNLPLTSQLYLDGDLLPGVTGIQPCPICTGGACQGGPNDGKPCTPGDSASLGTTNSFPTSQDCPPPAANNIGGLPIAFALTTGTKSMTATNNTTSGQNNVFCGYCRDATTGCFAGDQTAGCPTPLLSSPMACTSNSGCPAAYPDCEQRDPGAFGPAGGGAHTITVTGTPGGSLMDGAGHSSTLASVFCIQPTFNATVDAAGDLPGPGAVTLQGTAQLVP